MTYYAITQEGARTVLLRVERVAGEEVACEPVDSFASHTEAHDAMIRANQAEHGYTTRKDVEGKPIAVFSR